MKTLRDLEQNFPAWSDTFVRTVCNRIKKSAETRMGLRRHRWRRNRRLYQVLKVGEAQNDIIYMVRALNEAVFFELGVRPHLVPTKGPTNRALEDPYVLEKWLKAHGWSEEHFRRKPVIRVPTDPDMLKGSQLKPLEKAVKSIMKRLPKIAEEVFGKELAKTLKGR